MKFSSLLCLAIPGAVMATTTGSIPYPTCASGYYCNVTATATSTTTSAAPTYTAFEALEYPCPDDLILSCCDFVPSNRSYYNGLFDNTTHFPGCIPPFKTLLPVYDSCPIPEKTGECCTLVNYANDTIMGCKVAAAINEFTFPEDP